MVFFTCNSCGESLKKNKVDKHLSQCRSSSISCVDCGKDFTNDYNSHNQCVSEDQKYGGLDYKPKENSTKGKAKQEEWVQKAKTAISKSNCSPHIKNLLNRLSGYDNIPRKKPKFFNFVRSCLHINNEYYVQQMWNFFETIIKSDADNDQKDSDTNANQNELQNGNKRKLNDSDINQKPTNKKLKSENGSQKLIESENEDFNESQVSETDSVLKPKLKMKRVVIQILDECEDKTLSIKKLKKRVVKSFRSMDESLSKEDIVSKFFSKLNKIKKIQMDGGIVSLKEE